LLVYNVIFIVGSSRLGARTTWAGTTWVEPTWGRTGSGSDRPDTTRETIIYTD